jgi:hypothetical protein
MGLDGNPSRTEDQTRYSLFLEGPGWLPDGVMRTPGWHKLGFELLKDKTAKMYVDDKLFVEETGTTFEKLDLVGFLSYYGGDREGAVGTQLRESYWDDLKIYDRKP